MSQQQIIQILQPLLKNRADEHVISFVAYAISDIAWKDAQQLYQTFGDALIRYEACDDNQQALALCQQVASSLGRESNKNKNASKSKKKDKSKNKNKNKSGNDGNDDNDDDNDDNNDQKTDEKSKSNGTHQSSKYRIGSECMTLFADDGLFYPAKIIQVMDNNKYLIKYNDYSDEAEVNEDDIIIVKNKKSHISAHALANEQAEEIILGVIAKVLKGYANINTNIIGQLATAVSDLPDQDFDAQHIYEAIGDLLLIYKVTTNSQEAQKICDRISPIIQKKLQEAEDNYQSDREDEDEENSNHHHMLGPVKLLAAPIKIVDTESDDNKQKKSKATGMKWMQNQRERDRMARKDQERERARKKHERLTKKLQEDRRVRALQRKEEAQKLYLESLGRTENKAKEIDIADFSMSTIDGGAELLTHSDVKFVFGRRYGLVGRNGVGKSTLLQAVANYEVPSFPTNIRVLHVEQEATGDDTSVIDYVIRADYERDLLMKAEKEIQEQQKKFESKESKESAELSDKLAKLYERMKQIDAWGAEARAGTVLSGLGFSQTTMKAATKSLSGGWRMRVALAAALFVSPDILLLDEPTNHLDFPAVLWLEEYLKRYKNTLVLVSHDRSFVNNVVTDIIHFHEKKLIYYRGDYTTFERVRAEHRKSQQRAFDASEMKKKHIQKFIDKFRYNAKRASLVQSRIKALERMEVIDEVVDDPTFRFQFPEVETIRGNMITLSHVNFAYSPTSPVLLQDVNVSVDIDCRVGVVGANGVGKSTLIRIMMEDLQPTDGLVTSNGNARVSFFAQHHMDQLNPELSPLEYMCTLFNNANPQVVRAHLGRYGITDALAIQRIETLSGGQKSRVAFAVVTWNRPHLIVMDEPTNHLDLETIDALIVAVNSFSGGIVLISHDQHFLTNVCSDYWGVAEKRVAVFDSFEGAKKFCYRDL